jgi:hypothetical protein
VACLGHAVACPSAEAGHRRPAASFTVISPVFSQLVSFSMPSNFVAGEKAPYPSSIGKL